MEFFFVAQFRILSPSWMQPETLHVLADPSRLGQILTNLLTNAARYTPEGGRIWLLAQETPGEAILRVRDSGIGIPSEMLSRIFGLFAQVERQQERTGGGLGIGLSLVKSLAELHGGKVEAFSEGPGRGSEFTLHLPLAIGTMSPLSPAGARTPTAAAPPAPASTITSSNPSNFPLSSLLQPSDAPSLKDANQR